MAKKPFFKSDSVLHCPHNWSGLCKIFPDTVFREKRQANSAIFIFLKNSALISIGRKKKEVLTPLLVMQTKKRRFNSFSRVLLAAAAIIGGSLPASAIMTYNYAPPTPDLQDLDHHNAYMWTLSGLQTTQPYIGASLTISNINNWDLTKNILFMHLFDTALTTPAAGGSVVSGSGNNILTTFTDAAGDPVTVLSDAFGPSSLATNPLVNQSKTTNVMLGTYVDGSFSGTGTVIDGVTVPNYQTGTFTPPASPNQPETVTYNFTPSQLAALNSYITGAGGDAGRISLAFDSDCHFFNDGVTLTLTAVPEPGTAVAGIGCMLPILSSFFGRRRRSR